MQSEINKNLIIFRLFPNEDFFKELEKVSLKYRVQTAIIISGIGQFKNFELGFFKEKGNYLPQKFIKPHELLSLNGNIIKQRDNYKFHIHAVLADEKKKAIGGHLLKAKVEVTNEIIILKTDIKIERKIEEKTGLEGLLLEGSD